MYILTFTIIDLKMIQYNVDSFKYFINHLTIHLV